MAERGGRRQGTPGKAYSNRTDLNVMRAPQQGTVTAAAGGITPRPTTPSAGPAAPAGAPAAPSPQFVTPDQTPNLSDPGNPGVPLTAGIPSGPGAGAPAPGKADYEIIRKFLPDLQAAAKAPDAPTQFKALVRFIEGG